MKITKVISQAEAFKPIIVEAESGTVGSDFQVTTDANNSALTFVTIKTDAAAAGATNFPASLDRTISYQVTFPDSGTYSLYARINVGPDTFNDDSFFYGKTFGQKDPTVDTLWNLVNGLAAGGFSNASDVVREIGGAGSNVWKWVNISNNTFQSVGAKFIVPEGGTTYTFHVAGRENGLNIDKFAFGKSLVFYTVDNLDKGQAGVTNVPGGNIYNGPPLAHKQKKFLGSAHSNNQAVNFKSYWNKVTPENAGKWGSVEGTRNQMNWGGLDAAYNLAKENNFPFHFHVLIWGAQQPSWISSLTPEEQLKEIREWFVAVAQRYPDIDFLEVVNEPLLNHNPPDGTSGRANYKNALGGNGTTGYDWIINSFKMAREIFPAKTKLMLNDYSIINSSTSTAEYLKIIRLLKKENLIDLIGEQGHAFTTTAAVATMKRNLDSLASTGIPIHITELDIDGPTDATQLTQYKRIFPALWEHPGVEGITLWGWRPGLWRNDQKAYLIESNNVERPALVWLREYLDTLIVSVADEASLPQNFELFNNYPNPFNPTTNIKYHLPKQSYVSLRVYDVLGRIVETLVNDVQSPGQYTVTFNAQNLTSGVYFYRIEADGFVSTKKLILMK
jgi:endo-1,4-beta-xylanase